jgi:F-type H+-transporting ATPase subunit gamma
MIAARTVLRNANQAPPVVAFQCRNMATLKDISLRLKSVKNILKITSSMKMIAASRFAKADKELKASMTFGKGCQVFYKEADIKPLEAAADATKKPVKVLIALSSDRGLCGAIHSSISKAIRLEINNNPNVDYKVVIVGDKVRGQLQRTHPNNIFLTFKEVGKQMPSYGEASLVASLIIEKLDDFDVGMIYYNRFKSVVSYELDSLNIFNVATIAKAPGVSVYDSVDEYVLQNYQEASLTNLVYYAMKQASCSEHSSRMTAMDNASKNAGEMIGKLTLLFNRTRQAVITTELSEIISGAVAIEKKDK